MKIEKFLYWIQEKLMFYPEIDFKTVKMFSDKFFECMSKKERERWNIQISIIREYSLKQISIIDFLRENKINELENDLNNLKDDNKIDKLS